MDLISSEKSKLPLLIDILGNLAARSVGFQKRLGDFETRMLSADIENMKISAPVFIAGLPRSGSTLLLEVIAKRPEFAAHAYRDYPFVLTPILWNTILNFWPGMKGRELKERAHRDRIAVNADSPEAFDEIVWNAFFDRLHDPLARNTVVEKDRNAAFDSFYKEHVQKILFMRKGQRFVSKNNYNVGRIGYLRKIFPDAKFVVPVREPVAHVFSLLKQHRLFMEEQKADPRALRYMQRCGHYEFGQDFRPVNTGDGAVFGIKAFWDAGKFAEAYALYWRSIHELLLGELVQHKQAMIVISYEQLCLEAEKQLKRLADFCLFTMTEAEISRIASAISAPSYYRTDLTGQETDFIQNMCGGTYEVLLGKL